MTDPNAKVDLSPVVKTVEVPLSVEAAFTRFTDEISTWWPMAKYSVGQENTETVVLEGRVGGRLFERQRDGTESEWGRITTWEPPGRVAFTWHPSQGPEMAQEVEVRFRQADAGTEVELIHKGWEVLGERAEEVRHRYDGGWMGVLDQFVEG